MSVAEQLPEVVGFGPLTIAYDERVLRPRAWTVLQSEWAGELLPDLPAGPVLELCAGAGHIGLLATAGAGRHLVQVDANPAACRYALLNAHHAHRDDVEVRLGRMDDVVGPHERFPLVIADPPWVPSTDTSRHPGDPLTAIDGGADGLRLVRGCLEVIGVHLAPGGAALLQVGGPDQIATVEEYAEARPALDLTVVSQRLAPRGAVVRLARR